MASRAWAGLAKPVIVAALGLVTKHCVGFVDLLEPRFRPGTTAGILVGMVPTGQPAESSFDVIKTGVFTYLKELAAWGRWRMRMGPLWMPGTWQAHYRFPDHMLRTMRLYLARIPVLRGLDTCDLAKKEARTVIAGKVLDQGDKVVEAAAMAPWIDSLVFRSTAIFRDEVRWDEQAAETVAMSYPNPVRSGERDELVITFSDGGRLIRRVSAMRWMSSKSTEKDPWRIEVHASERFQGILLPSEFSITWERQGTPWSYWYLGGMVLNPEAT